MSGSDSGVIADSTSGFWAAYSDEEGNVYYYNSHSGETSWEPPTGWDSTEVTHTDAPVTERPEWFEQKNPDGHLYYVNTATGESTWQRPTSGDIIALRGELSAANGHTPTAPSATDDATATATALITADIGHGYDDKASSSLHSHLMPSGRKQNAFDVAMTSLMTQHFLSQVRENFQKFLAILFAK